MKKKINGGEINKSGPKYINSSYPPLDCEEGK
jgi:hypothetical protein